jgi:hypothetical protein
LCEKIIEAAGDAPYAWEAGEKVLNGEPAMEDDSEDPMGCCAARPVNMAPGENGIVDEEYLDEESRLFGPDDSAEETECCCWWLLDPFECRILLFSNQ